MSSFVAPRPNPRARLRELLAAAQESRRPLVAPGAYDALGARLVQQAGFDVVYMTGFGTSASLLGRPDIGLLGGAEMTDNARRMAQAVEVPLIADADTGYGNALNVVRTVREYEQAGVAGLQLEDQISPKRCGHMTGKAVVDVEEAVAKVRAAVAARTDPDLVVIARTDVAQVEGTRAAIDRALRFADAGADVLFVEAPRTAEDVELVATQLKGHHLLFNWVEGGATEGLTMDTVAELGFSLVLFPISTLLAATQAMQTALSTLKRTSSTEGSPMGDFGGFLETIGLPGIREDEARFAV
ncbi:isocitrate lyase/PEP mutase family protein [Klenkia brasiliensis]|uniref:2-Methylisocitrate lyase, PEP mutase family n=1 Tax=Klenkia brasiliensis TaxID=333142 RepID=A0A1G7PVM8_9ACTN|nr:isocitrate lyase/PEP mutase family protein [Klenkia brasiliensis]SDF89659.1 2-Methylisocitrate lyase, PEP mutase family [Klenkia brasiliensis]